MNQEIRSGDNYKYSFQKINANDKYYKLHHFNKRSI